MVNENMGLCRHTGFIPVSAHVMWCQVCGAISTPVPVSVGVAARWRLPSVALAAAVPSAVARVEPNGCAVEGCALLPGHVHGAPAPTTREVFHAMFADASLLCGAPTRGRGAINVSSSALVVEEVSCIECLRVLLRQRGAR